MGLQGCSEQHVTNEALCARPAGYRRFSAFECQPAACRDRKSVGHHAGAPGRAVVYRSLFLFALRPVGWLRFRKSVQSCTDCCCDSAEISRALVSRSVMQQSQQSPSIFLIGRPSCEKCSRRMALMRIAPDGPDHDRRTFECPACGHYEVHLVPFVHGPTNSPG